MELIPIRSFVGQAPIFAVSILLCWVSLPRTSSKPRAAKDSTSSKHESQFGKLRQVDFLGSALLASFLILILLPLEIGGNKIPWTDARIPILFSAGVLCLIVFIVVEKWWATNPLLPLNLFCNRHTVVSFLVLALQCAAQLGVSCMETRNHPLTQLITIK